MVKRIATALGILSLAAFPNTGTAQSAGKKLTKIASAESTVQPQAGGNHSKLVDILKSAGFASALQGNGEFTIFAPTNGAFSKLPAGKLSDLLRPENQSALKMVLAHHVVRGNITSSDLKRALDEGNGSASFKTLAGDSLTFRQSGNRVIVSDSRGNVSTVNASNAQQGGNIVHSVDKILL